MWQRPRIRYTWLHRLSQGELRRPWLHQLSEYLVILCFDRRYTKQNNVTRLESNILAHPKILGWLRHCLAVWNWNVISITEELHGFLVFVRVARNFGILPDNGSFGEHHLQRRSASPASGTIPLRGLFWCSVLAPLLRRSAMKRLRSRIPVAFGQVGRRIDAGTIAFVLAVALLSGVAWIFLNNNKFKAYGWKGIWPKWKQNRIPLSCINCCVNCGISESLKDYSYQNIALSIKLFHFT